MPKEVISEVFNVSPGESVTINSRSGDVYIVDLVGINKPTSESLNPLLEEYTNISEERAVNNISAIINKDIFDSAKVNLNNLVF